MTNLSKKLKFALLSLFVLPTMAQVEQVKKPLWLPLLPHES